jgi:DNA-3-methyladenine glycosylase II
MVDIVCAEPFNLGLSLEATHSFDRSPGAPTSSGVADASPAVLRLGVRLNGRPTLLEVRQASDRPAVLKAESRPASPSQPVRRLVERVVNASLDLHPFYALVAEHEVLGPATRALWGLKPFRPVHLFDMLVLAIIEQQISLVAARHIRGRLVERFGDVIEDFPVFPRAETLAEVPLEALIDCGLSRRKAEYVHSVAGEIVSGALDLDELEKASPDTARSRLAALRGFGSWSADYVLVRGLGRMDVVPADDLGVRAVLGRALADGRRLSAKEVGVMLAPFSPHRGLATFYLLVADRLALGGAWPATSRGGSGPATSRGGTRRGTDQRGADERHRDRKGAENRPLTAGVGLSREGRRPGLSTRATTGKG